MNHDDYGGSCKAGSAGDNNNGDAATAAAEKHDDKSKPQEETSSKLLAHLVAPPSPTRETGSSRKSSTKQQASDNNLTGITSKASDNSGESNDNNNRSSVTGNNVIEPADYYVDELSPTSSNGGAGNPSTDHLQQQDCGNKKTIMDSEIRGTSTTTTTITMATDDGQAATKRVAAARRGSADLGLLALSVDFSSSCFLSPAAFSPFAAQVCDYEDDEEYEGGQSRHLIEVSLCIRQQQQLQRLGADTFHYCDSSNRRQSSAASYKRRLIYERIDKFPLEIGSILRPKSRHLSGRQRQTGRADTNNKLELGKIEKQMKFLPFRDCSFDACFGMNLLDARVTNRQQQANERQQQQQQQQQLNEQQQQANAGSLESDNVVYRQELEQNWLKLERLTEELRLALLIELARIVKVKGKIMLTVFACECSSSSSSSNNNKNKKPTATDRSGADESSPPAASSTSSKCKQRRSEATTTTTTHKPSSYRSKQEKQEEEEEDVRTRAVAVVDEENDEKEEEEEEENGSSSEQEEEAATTAKQQEEEATSDNEAADSCCPRCRLEWTERQRKRAESKQQKRRQSRLARRDSLINRERQSNNTNSICDLASFDKTDAAATGAATAEQRQTGSNSGGGGGGGYSSRLWKAMSGGSGSLSLIDQQEFYHFQFHRDSLSEAAKRFGRRLSIGGNSLINRLFSSLQDDDDQRDEGTTTLEQQQHQIEFAAQEPSRCCDEATVMPDDGKKVQATCDLLSPYDHNQAEEFTKRHRQSIAVQNFFTKSVEMHDDDDVEYPVDLGQSYEDVSQMMLHEDETTTSGWTAPTDLTTTNDESRTDNNNNNRRQQKARAAAAPMDGGRDSGRGQTSKLDPNVVNNNNDDDDDDDDNRDNSCMRLTGRNNEPQRQRQRQHTNNNSSSLSDSTQATSANVPTTGSSGDGRDLAAESHDLLHLQQVSDTGNGVKQPLLAKSSTSAGTSASSSSADRIKRNRGDSSSARINSDLSSFTLNNTTTTTTATSNSSSNPPLDPPLPLPNTTNNIRLGGYNRADCLIHSSAAQGWNSFTAAACTGSPPLNQSIPVHSQSACSSSQPTARGCNVMHGEIPAVIDRGNGGDELLPLAQRRAFSETEAYLREQQQQQSSNLNITSSPAAAAAPIGITAGHDQEPANVSDIITKPSSALKSPTAPPTTATATAPTTMTSIESADLIKDEPLAPHPSLATLATPSSDPILGPTPSAATSQPRPPSSSVRPWQLGHQQPADIVHQHHQAMPPTSQRRLSLAAGLPLVGGSAGTGAGGLQRAGQKQQRQQSATTTSGSTTMASDSFAGQQQPHQQLGSMASLIGAAAGQQHHHYQHHYHQQQHQHHRGQQQPSYALLMNEQSPSLNNQQQSKYHRQQWFHSNTFSSSQNSDISTSGGPTTKDSTTEKDSSRRTSTLSGISSIYQQEISLGLNYVGGPIGGGGGGSSSTPANSSQAAACSNMGSIPELATLEPLQPTAATTTAPAPTTTIFQSMNNQQQQQTVSKSVPPSQPLEWVGHSEEPASNLMTDKRQLDENDSAGNQDTSGGSGGQSPLNLQRVAQSLRERLSTTMRPLNAFMGLSSTDVQTGQQSQQQQQQQLQQRQQQQRATMIQEELASDLAEGADIVEPMATANNHFQQLSQQQQQQQQLQVHASISSRSEATPTTPATLKSFFRSTSNAAFSAFTSSFQQQQQHQPSSAASSYCNTPTLTQQPAHLSTASDVFESVAPATKLSDTLATDSSTQAAPTGAPMRSPLSPISVTSTRFFARIRDKFSNLSPPASASSSPLQQQRPSSSNSITATLSSTASANTIATAILARQQQADRQQITEEEPHAEGATRSDQDIDDKQRSRTRETGDDHHQVEPPSIGEDTMPSSGLLTSTSVSLSNRSSECKKAADVAKIDQSDFRFVKTTIDDFTSESSSSYDADYERVVSSRRPSFQRQLDEQVNQVYRMAVDRKLQNSPISTSTFEMQFHQQTPGQTGYSDLDSIIRPVSSILNPIQPAPPPPLDSLLGSCYAPVDQFYPTTAMRYNSDFVNSNPTQQQQQQVARNNYHHQWLDSSQQSIESSSSARSLRSCWFSMPELYAMNQYGDSNSSSVQSPSGLLAQKQLAQPTSSKLDNTMDELLGAISREFLPPKSVKEPEAMDEDDSKQQQHHQLTGDWPSNQLYKQLASGQQRENWSLSDLNLTSDDIAPSSLPAPAALSATSPEVIIRQRAAPISSPGPANAPIVAEPTDAQANLMKCSTLDDSICASIKSSSTEANIKDGSRPTSQNSTISNTSCTLSDTQLPVVGTQQEQEPPAASKPVSPMIIEALKPADGDEADQLLVPAHKQTRAMSLRPPSSCGPDRDLLTPTGSGSGIAPPRRRSAMGSIMRAGPDIAPAAATLDLRLAARKNRVKLTDLHPITFINDRKFLESMSSLKKAGDNRLDAIFNSPVGRRLSVNAEIVAAQQQQSPGGGQSRSSGIKIGLNGYVHLDRSGSPHSRQSLLTVDPTNPRRPSLAPNFWRQLHSGAGSLHPSQTGADNSLSPHSLAGARPRAASYTPTIIRPPEEPAADQQPLLPVEKPAPIRVSSRRQSLLSPVSHGHHQPVVGSYALDKRRSTIALLARLSESSIELDHEPPASGDTRATKEAEAEREEQPRPATAAAALCCSSSTITTSTTNSNQAADQKQSNKAAAGAARFSTSDGMADCSADSSTGGAAGAGDEHDEHDEDDRDAGGSSRRCGGNAKNRTVLATMSDSSDSSDDGDIEKLVAQYETPPMPVRHHGSTKMHASGDFGCSNNERIVKNDMILKQLLLASNAATLGNNRTATSNKGRRFSAINLYQRDEDVFVANSMKRAPSNQFQVLTALPLLAGTLPVLPANHHQHQMERDTYNRLPVMRNSIQQQQQQSGQHIKSIISGTSGIQNMNTSPRRVQDSSSQMVRANSVSSTLVAEVDVLEQLNRLRQQEKRSFGSSASNSMGQSGSFGRYSLSSPTSSLHESQDSSDLLAIGDVVVPNQPRLPAILRPPATITPVARDSQETIRETKVNTPDLELPPPSSKSPLLIRPAQVEPIPKLMGSGTVVEPSAGFTKQLDTIIEGRGLLLGPEQQADPSYANRLRRLSAGQYQISSSRRSSHLESPDLWCACDVTETPKRRHLSLQQQQLHMQSAATTTDPAGFNSPSLSSSSKYVLDTVRSLARRTISNFKSQTSVEEKKPPAASSETKPIASSSSSDSSTVEDEGQSDEDEEEDLDDEDEDDSSLISLDDAENYRTKNKDNKMKHGRSLESSSSSSSSTTLAADNVGDHPDGNQLEGERLDEEEEEFDDEEEDLEDEDEVDDDEEEEEEEQEQPKICYKCNKRIKMLEPLNEDSPMKKVGNHTNGADAGRKSIGDDGIKVTAGQQQQQLPGGSASSSINSTITANLIDGAGSSPLATISANASSNSLLATSACVAVKVTSGEVDPLQQQQHQQQQQQNNTNNKSSQASIRARRRTARRSASMNSADPSHQQQQQQHPHEQGGQILPSTNSSSFAQGRRKNKWHIQRNLAPKLKRQRSFSANYAPEVPNLMMPPPRRYSAAPTLTCPHRNKSHSSHSSSSLQHTYSIDSSDSMITVIPANGARLNNNNNSNNQASSSNQQPLGGGGCDLRDARSPRGSLSCASSAQHIGSLIGGVADHGSGATSPHYSMARSPLSPRSPSRLGGGSSPFGLLTPNTSEPPTPFSPSNTLTSTTTTTTGMTCTVVSRQLLEQSPRANTDNRRLLDQQDVQLSLDMMATDREEGRENGQDVNSMAVENGTSYSSSRNEELNELNSDFELGDLDETKQEVGEEQEQGEDEEEKRATRANNNNSRGGKYSRQQPMDQDEFEDDDEGQEMESIDPSLPLIVTTINDFCARHSREELEFLIGRIEWLRISDCYYSEKSSTLCMVIEVQGR